MTDTKTFSLTYEMIERLFETAVCMTYNPLEPRSAWQYGNELLKDFFKQNPQKRGCLCSKTAIFQQDRYNPRFHYFSDGTLIHCSYPQGEKHAEIQENLANELKRILKLLEIRGLPVKKIYAPQNAMDFIYYSEFLRHISEQAFIYYSYKTDLYVEALPEKADFVRECFAGGNVLVTAAKDENLPFCRDFMALFADGRYYISEKYASRFGSANHGKISLFRQDYLQFYPYCNPQYVPQEYIDALYEKAKEFDWYISPEEAQLRQKNGLTADALIKMNKYIDALFQNRTCLTVTNPDFNSSFMAPDSRQYAVFSDGLVVSAYHDETDKIFIRDLVKYFPNLTFRFEKVLAEYIKQLYRRLPEFQKSATEIYLEMLKQKARKLKRMTELTHMQALDVVAQMAGWNDWRSIKIEDEAHARGLIDAEKWRKNTAADFNPENPLAEEYRHFLKHHK